MSEVRQNPVEHSVPEEIRLRWSPVSYAPEPLEDGVVFSTQLADGIFRETGVRANYRARKQLGKNRNVTPSGPSHELE